MTRPGRVVGVAVAVAVLVGAAGCTGTNERPGGSTTTSGVERYPAIKLAGPADVQQYLSSRGVTCSGLQLASTTTAPTTTSSPTSGASSGRSGPVGTATCDTTGGRLALAVYASAAGVPAVPAPDCAGGDGSTDGQELAVRARGENFTVTVTGSGTPDQRSALTERVGTQSGLLVETTTVRCR